MKDFYSIVDELTVITNECNIELETQQLKKLIETIENKIA